MNLALVGVSLGPGGAERVLSLLASHCAGYGHEVHLLLFDRPCARAYFAVDAKVCVHNLDLLSESRGPLAAAAANLRRVLAIRRALARCGAQAVVAFLPEAGVLAVLAALWLRIPAIVSERVDASGERLRWPWAWLRRLCYPLATAVVFQTCSARDSFPVSARIRAVVIANPVTIPSAQEQPSEASVVIGVGRLVPQKGFDLLIEAFGHIAPRYPEWSLAIWGEGPERERLEARIARAGLGGRISLPGLSPEPGAWVTTGAVFALPSRYEGFPNALCEAMAAGLAVIAADCRWGPAELVAPGVDGLLVPPGDAAALAAGLDRLLANPEERRRLGVGARASIRRFESTGVMKQWDRLIASVVE